jgi:hypothetical protein
MHNNMRRREQSSRVLESAERKSSPAQQLDENRSNPPESAGTAERRGSPSAVGCAPDGQIARERQVSEPLICSCGRMPRVAERWGV